MTAAGIVSAAGDTAESLFSVLLDHRPLKDGAPGALGPAGMRGVPSIPVHGFDPKKYLDRKGLGNLSRTSQLACAAASRLAGGLTGTAHEEIGVVFGTAWGSLQTVVDFERATFVDGPRFVDPFLFAETVPNVPSGQISIFFGWSACNMTVSSGTSSGLAALSTAIDLLGEGRAGLVVAGGGDELNQPLLRALLAEGKLCSTGGSLPYADARRGPIGGEGACLLAVESRGHAAARGARPLARVRACERRFAAGPDKNSKGPVVLLRLLLERAGLAPGAIDLVVVSASGRTDTDLVEGRALLEVFGGGDSAPPLLAPKAVLGETWGASGPLGVAAALESFRRGQVPAPPGRLVVSADLSGLNLPRTTMAREVRHAIVLDCGATGEAAGILLSKEEGGDVS